MTIITFPRAVPAALQPTGLSFYPEPMIEVTPLRSGRQISTNLGPTLWRGRWNATVWIDALDAIRAWYDTLLSSEAFYGFDMSRVWPKAYGKGFAGLTVSGSPFDGACTITTVAANNVEITVAALPANFILSVGDYIAFDYGADSRALHRIVAGATASGAGVAQVEVRPPIRPGWGSGSSPESALANLYRAAARMIIVPGSYSESIALPGRLCQVSFEAIQTL